MSPVRVRLAPLQPSARGETGGPARFIPTTELLEPPGNTGHVRPDLTDLAAHRRPAATAARPSRGPHDGPDLAVVVAHDFDFQCLHLQVGEGRVARRIRDLTERVGTSCATLV